MSIPKDKQYLVLKLAENPLTELNKVLDYLELPENEVIAFDIETNSENERLAKVIGIGVTATFNNGIYIPLRRYDLEKQELVQILDDETEKQFIAALCEVLLKKKLLMHNGVYDITVMKLFYGIDLTEALYADTILMKHTLNEERPFGLKDLAEIYKEQIGISSAEVANQEQLDLKDSVVANGGKWTKEKKDIYKGNLEIIGRYCCADVDLTLRLFDYFDKQLELENALDFFYDGEVMPLYKKVTIPMKLGGVFIDVPYFKNLEKELENGIMELTGEIFSLIEADIEPFVKEILDDKIKETRTGKYAEGVLRYYEIPIPLNKKTGKPTLAKSALQHLEAMYPDHPALKWLCFSQNSGEEPKLPKKVVYEIKKRLFAESNPELPHVFNLASNQQLAWLIFERYKQEPKSYSRKTEKPQVDKASLELYEELPFVKVLLKLKKEEKLLTTYVRPIIEKNIEGWIYPSMLQFGTTSGRYSCAGGLNLQTLPRDDKRIKKGFIAPQGYKVVNADFSSLEPRIFSWVCGDPGLKQVWNKGLDLYSQIAIDVFNLDGVSADEKAPNFLKTVAPEKRAISKVFTLAVPYGANEYRISELMKCDPMEAKDIIEKYLYAYPMLKDYMQDQEFKARRYGSVKTKFGRIRHLPEAKKMYERYKNALFSKKGMERMLGDFGSDEYYRFRNLLNNAKNAPIQMTAAHVCNHSMIKLSDLFKKHTVDGWIALQIHDEITCIVSDKDAKRAADLLKISMEKNWITEQIDIPILAEPVISTNFADAK